MPGVSLRLAFRTIEKEHTFFLFNKAHKDLVQTFLDNLVGGPAFIFDRYQEKGMDVFERKLNIKICVISIKVDP